MGMIHEKNAKISWHCHFKDGLHMSVRYTVRILHCLRKLLYTVRIWHCLRKLLYTVRIWHCLRKLLYTVRIWHCLRKLYTVRIWHCLRKFFVYTRTILHRNGDNILNSLPNSSISKKNIPLQMQTDAIFDVLRANLANSLKLLKNISFKDIVAVHHSIAPPPPPKKILM